MNRSSWLAAAVLAGMSVGCSDTTGISVNNLAGTWNATKFEFSNPANASQKADLITLGGSFTLTITAAGAYTATISEPGGFTETDSGTISVSGDKLTISESGESSPSVMTVTLSGSTMTLETSDEKFDFNDDGTDEPARLVIVLVKQ